MSNLSPQGAPTGEDHDGFYVFFFLHHFKQNPTGGVLFDVWIHRTWAHTLEEAKAHLMEQAQKCGLVEEIIANPLNMQLQFLPVKWLDQEIDRIYGLDTIEPNLKEEDMTLRTEAEYQRVILKNALMKRIIDGKNTQLLQASHDVLTPEEVQYLHDKITQ